MRRLVILVVLGLAFAVGAEAGPKPQKPISPPKPAAGKMQAPKNNAPKGGTVKATAAKTSPVKVSGQSKGSTMKMAAAPPKGSPVKTKSAQATASSSKSVKPAKTDVKLAKANTSASKTETKSAKVQQTTKKKTTTNAVASSGTSTSSPGTASTPRTAFAPIDFTATKVGAKLQKNSAIRSKIEAKLQAAGYTGTVYEAAYGFKNLGQLNAATNQVQNQGYSFNLLKVLMTGTYVDPQTHVVYRANQMPDGTVNLVRARFATNPASTQSLGQAKQAIAGGAEMPTVVRIPPPPTGTHTPPPPTGTRIPPPTGTSTTSR